MVSGQLTQGNFLASSKFAIPPLCSLVCFSIGNYMLSSCYTCSELKLLLQVTNGSNYICLNIIFCHWSFPFNQITWKDVCLLMLFSLSDSIPFLLFFVFIFQLLTAILFSFKYITVTVQIAFFFFNPIVVLIYNFFPIGIQILRHSLFNLFLVILEANGIWEETPTRSLCIVSNIWIHHGEFTKAQAPGTLLW